MAWKRRGSPRACGPPEAHTAAKWKEGRDPQAEGVGMGAAKRPQRCVIGVQHRGKGEKRPQKTESSKELARKPGNVPDQSTSSNASKKSKKKGNDTYRLPGTPKSSEDPLGARFSTCTPRGPFTTLKSPLGATSPLTRGALVLLETTGT
jgi:hypothetical protein